ncbi:carboxylesterase/lipase family protein [Actinokineospora pegani]|uniref:carboxylesterase/lipase family protein n=1 Tax=Actinokineospora pegani TaxID=2654637 RepID=UPI0012EA55EF|nr:carboxylesterase family protein [Actinokineospora pegani]
MVKMGVRGLLGALVVLGAALTASANAADGRGPVLVGTEGGLVRGGAAGPVRTFRAIPYAAPPVGELRWRAPGPVVPWAGVRDATSPGSACVQLSPGQLPPGVRESEDCLNLTVTTKAKPGAGKPVIVWVHGGGFANGTSAAVDATRMVDRGDVVVVAVNYRLGALGYLGLPGLAGSGTFGLQDQQAALRWVRGNIAAFGGDARRVTVAGQSAGGVSACLHLTSPGSRGLFSRVVMQSGSCDTNISLVSPGVAEVAPARRKFTRPLAEVEAAGRRAAATLGCADVACLRALDAGAVRAITPGSAVVAHGTPTLPEDPVRALRRGHAARVPVLSGANADESRLLVSISHLLDGALTDERYAEVLADGFGARAAAVRAVYDPARFPDASGRPSPALALAALMTDRDFACPQYETNALLPGALGYSYSDPDAPTGVPSHAPGFTMGTPHLAELYSLFDMTPAPVRSDGSAFVASAAQKVLADRMVDDWAAFAAGREPWRAGTTQGFAPGAVGEVDAFAAHRCGFWRTIP